MESTDCLVCAFPFDSSTRLHTYGVCGHLGVCSICYLRMRAIQRQFTCPTCKTELERVICTKEDHVNFTDFNIWGDSIGPDFTYVSQTSSLMPTLHHT